jgi:hypothetical protein
MSLNLIDGSKRRKYYGAEGGFEYIMDAVCCDCDKQFTIHTKYIKKATGKCGSCRTTKHGLYGTRSYWAWAEMKKRCDNPKQVFYYRYGGRGITYQADWVDFINFYRDMGDCPEGLELDRTDNEGNYTKDNCKWVTHKENCNNRSNSLKNRK